MAAADIDDRIAALEEHIVSTRPSTEEYLDRAERSLAGGDLREARHCLQMAKIRSNIDEIHRLLEDAEDDDDA